MLLAIFCSLLFFTSCDVAPKLSSISLISTSFDTGSTTYPGGVIIVGERTDAAGKVSYSFSGSSNLAIQIERGDWTFYGIGYAGPDKFTGDVSCALQTVSFRGGAATSVRLDLSTEGCSGKLSRTLKFKNVAAHSCSAFYTYNTEDNTYDAINQGDQANWCLTTNDQKQSLPYFKISALNMINSTKSTGVSTSCLLNNMPSYNLPSEIIPFQVSFYRSLEECQSILAPHVSYDLINGLKAGDPASFNHFYQETTPTTSRLVLPGAMTKSFVSPFMNMIPRMLCDANGACFSEPALTTHMNVPWDGELKDQLIAQNTSLSSCDRNNWSSKYFTIKDCYVKNRHMYATVKRNSLQCVPTATYGVGTIKYLYERNNHIYTLYTTGGTTRVSIRTNDSIHEHDFEVGADTTFNNLAATDAGELYVVSNTKIRRFTLSSGVYTFVKAYSFTSIDHFEITPDGKYGFIARDASQKIYTYDANKEIYVSEMTYTDSIKQLQFKDGMLYRMTYGPIGVGTGGSLFKTIVDPVSGELIPYPNLTVGGWTEPGLIARSYDMNNFYIANDKLYLLNPNLHGLYTFVVSPTTGEWVIQHGSGGGQVMGGAATVMIVTGDHFYFTDNTSIYSYDQIAGGTWVNISDEDGTCTESVVVNKGLSTETLNLKTLLTPGPEEVNPRLYDAAFKLVGLRDISNPRSAYYFDHLNSGQQRPTSSGKLSLPQYLLGPAGVGGMLSEYASCTEIKNLLVFSPSITKTFSVSDPYTGARSYQINLSRINDIIPPFNCGDATPFTACPNQYDLLINVTSTGLDHKEKYKLKLKCETKVGALEYFNYSSDESQREITTWNTNNPAIDRVDSLQMFENSSNFNAELSLVSKINDGEIWGRSISINKTSEKISSSSIEYQRNTSQHALTFIDIEDSPDDYFSNPTYVSNAASTSSAGTADICYDKLSTSLSFASDTCNIVSQSGFDSRGILLSIGTMDEAEDPEDSFQQYFTISP